MSPVQSIVQMNTKFDRIDRKRQKYFIYDLTYDINLEFKG